MAIGPCVALNLPSHIKKKDMYCTDINGIYGAMYTYMINVGTVATQNEYVAEEVTHTNL